MKTQGKIGAAICEGIRRFEQENRGRGPKDIHAHSIHMNRMLDDAYQN